MSEQGIPNPLGHMVDAVEGLIADMDDFGTDHFVWRGTTPDGRRWLLLLGTGEGEQDLVQMLRSASSKPPEIT